MLFCVFVAWNTALPVIYVNMSTGVPGRISARVAIQDILVHGLGHNAVHVLTALLSTTAGIHVLCVNRIVLMKNLQTSVNAANGFMDNAVNIVRFLFNNIHT